jgi:membrane protein
MGTPNWRASGNRSSGRAVVHQMPTTVMKSWWNLVRNAAANWATHKDARQGAALAYYSVFSLGPLLVIAIAISGLVFGEEAVRGEVASQLKGLLGNTGAQAVEAMLSGASKPAQGVLGTVMGIGTLLFAAAGVVVQLKDALNTVWEVEPPKAGGIWTFLRTYIVSLAGVLALGFLLLVSLVLTTLLSAGGKYFATYMPEATLQGSRIVSLLWGDHSLVCDDVQMAARYSRRLAQRLAWRHPHHCPL